MLWNLPREAMSTARANQEVLHLLGDKPTVPSNGVGRHLRIDTDDALSVPCIPGTVPCDFDMSLQWLVAIGSWML